MLTVDHLVWILHPKSKDFESYQEKEILENIFGKTNPDKDLYKMTYENTLDISLEGWTVFGINEQYNHVSFWTLKELKNVRDFKEKFLLFVKLRQYSKYYVSIVEKMIHIEM